MIHATSAVLAAATPATSDVTIAPVFEASLKRLQAAETRLRSTFVALDGVRQALGGLPQFLIDAYNASVAKAAPVLDRRLQEYAAAGGSLAARTPLSVITTRAVASQAKYQAVSLGEAEALKAIRAAAAATKDWVPSDQLAVVTSDASMAGGRATLRADTWEQSIAENRLALAGLHGTGFGFPAIAIVAIVLGVGLVAAIVADVIRDFHADSTKQAIADAEARAVEAQATVVQARIAAFQSTYESCLRSGQSATACAQAAADAAVRVGEVPPAPSKVGTLLAGLTLYEKLGIAVLTAGGAAATYFGVRHYRRTKHLRTAYAP